MSLSAFPPHETESSIRENSPFEVESPIRESSPFEVESPPHEQSPKVPTLPVFDAPLGLLLTNNSLIVS
jgi:hypothetical protein